MNEFQKTIKNERNRIFIRFLLIYFFVSIEIENPFRNLKLKDPLNLLFKIIPEKNKTTVLIITAVNSSIILIILC